MANGKAKHFSRDAIQFTTRRISHADVEADHLACQIQPMRGRCQNEGDETQSERHWVRRLVYPQTTTMLYGRSGTMLHNKLYSLGHLRLSEDITSRTSLVIEHRGLLELINYFRV